ncbi:MAG: hypothetical protein HGN29_16450 [Asgard group archaeon]|nr:hypothetical protein [Asgard group archaeon]
MVEEQKSKFFFFGFIPRCPFYKLIPVLIIFVLIALGTWGIYYLNLWAAVAYLVYSLLFYFVIMPLTMCKHCYFKVIKTSTDEETGKTTKKLMDVDKWGKTLIHKHVGQKNWVWPMFLIWSAPIVIIIIALVRGFNYLPLIALIGFVVVVVGNFFYMIKVKCPTCPIREYCHEAF